MMHDADLATLPLASEPAAPAAPRRTRLPWMLWTRRVHLYSGLFLLPWAALYGVTALLFNHPAWFSPTTSTQLERSVPLPQAEPLAAALLAEVAANPSFSGRSIALVPGSARWEHAIAWRVAGDAADHTLIVEPGQPGATLRSAPKGPPPGPDALAGTRSKLGPRAFEATTAAVGSLAAELALGPGRPTPRSVPDLEMLVEIDGEPHLVRHDLQSGTVVARAADAARPPAWRAFLLRLHLTHGYPSEVNARWLWALASDAMGVSLLVWAASGVLMWLQMRGLRRPGLLALGLGLASAAALALAMRALLSA